jgi:hypothetical protein
MATQLLSRYATIVLLVLMSMTFAGCQIVGDIFKAGVWVGVLGVVVVVALVGFLVAKVMG